MGIKSAVAFLILKAGVDMAKKIEKKPLPIITFVIVFAAMIILDLLSVSFSSVFYIIIGGITGIIVYSIIGIGKVDKKKEGKQ